MNKTILYSGRCCEGNKQVTHRVTGEGYYQLSGQGQPFHEGDGCAEAYNMETTRTYYY